MSIEAAWKRAAEGVRAEPWFEPGGWFVRQMGPTGLQLSKRNGFTIAAWAGACRGRRA